MKLFRAGSHRKLLIFVLRDFNPASDNAEVLQEIILDDVKKIWSEMYKQEDAEESQATDFFDFRFEMLPHKVFQEEAFTKKCDLLAQRFTET